MCLINNPHCEEGLIRVGQRYKNCKCQYVHGARRFFEDAGGGNGYMKFPNELDFDPKIITENMQAVGYKALMSVMDSEIHNLIEEESHIMLAGNPGTGKSQFAQTMLYLAGYKFTKENKSFKATILDVRKIRDYIFNTEVRSKLHERISHPNHRLLIIDDLGVEMNIIDGLTPRLVEEMDTLFRLHHGATIITSNVDPEKYPDVYNASIPNAQRMLSYLQQNFKTYMFVDKNIRQQPKTNSVLKRLP